MINNQQIVIEPGTEAFDMLKRTIAAAEARDVSVSLVLGPRGGVQMRSGGAIWTTPLTARKDRAERGQPCGDPKCPCS
jgi:hypothetical protein